MSTKLSIEQANEFLSKIGVEIAVVADAEQADTNANIETLATGVFADVEEKMKAEVEFDVKEAARNEALGKMLGSMRRSVSRHYGIKSDELENLTMDDIVKYSKEKITENTTGAQTDYQKRHEEMVADYEERLSKKDGEWQAKLDETNGRYTTKMMEERLVSLINEIPRKDGVDPIRLAKMALREMKDDFSLKFNEEEKSIGFFDKSNPEKLVFDGKNPITDKYFAKKFVESMGGLATDTRHIPPSTVNKGGAAGAQSGIVRSEADTTADPVAFLKEQLGA